jgi:hypothetical protein
MAYQRMATPYDQPPLASSSLAHTTGLSPQASKGWLFILNNPARPCFSIGAHWKCAKEEHFSEEMVHFLVQHYASLPAIQYQPIVPGRPIYHQRVYLSTKYARDGAIFRGHANYRSDGPWYDWVI